MSFVAALSCCFAQNNRTNERPVDKTQIQLSKTADKGSERRTGAQPKYKYKIEKIVVADEDAMDAKLTLSASTRAHKISVKSNAGNARISWKLLADDGSQLDENWWIGNSTSIAFGRYGVGDYYLDFTDALGKQAQYKITKKIN